MANYSELDFQAAMKRLEARRDASYTKMEQNIAVANTRWPRLAEIELEMKQLMGELGKVLTLTGEERQREKIRLKEKGDRLTRERDNIFLSNGLPVDFMQRQFTCKKCNDTGYTQNGMCDCLKTLLKQIQFDRINAISGIQLADFDSFDLKYYSKELKGGPSDYQIMEGNLKYCKDYAEKFTPQTAKNLLLIGGTGLGKTHLSLSIAKQVINKGYFVIYGTASDLMSTMEREHFDRDMSETTIKSLLECDLLILDDLGTEFITAFANSCLYNLINGRINAGLPTIINTNMTYRELEDNYTPRICSRLMGAYQEIPFYGDDIRIQKNNAEQ